MFDTPVTETLSSAAVSGNVLISGTPWHRTHTLTRHVGALIAAMLLTAALSAAIPQQVEAAPSSDAHVSVVQDGVGVLAASGDATGLAFVVTKGQKG